MADVIVKEFETLSVFFERDGWFNATLVAAANGKSPKDWLNLSHTLELILVILENIQSSPVAGFNEINRLWEELKASNLSSGVKQVKILELVKKSGLVRVKRGSPENGGGTWMHPKLAVHFGYWLSAKFAVWVGDKIEEIIKREKVVDILPTVVHPTYGYPIVAPPEDLTLRGERNTYATTLMRLGFRAPTYIQELTDLVNQIFTGDRARHLRFRYNITNRHRRTRKELDANLRRAMGIVERTVCVRFRQMQSHELNFENMLRVAEDVSFTVFQMYLERDVDLIENIPRRRLDEEHNARLFSIAR